MFVFKIFIQIHLKSRPLIELNVRLCISCFIDVSVYKLMNYLFLIRFEIRVGVFILKSNYAGVFIECPGECFY